MWIKKTYIAKPKKVDSKTIKKYIAKPKKIAPKKSKKYKIKEGQTLA